MMVCWVCFLDYLQKDCTSQLFLLLGETIGFLMKIHRKPSLLWGGWVNSACFFSWLMCRTQYLPIFCDGELFRVPLWGTTCDASQNPLLKSEKKQLL